MKRSLSFDLSSDDELRNNEQSARQTRRRLDFEQTETPEPSFQLVPLPEDPAPVHEESDDSDDLHESDDSDESDDLHDSDSEDEEQELGSDHEEFNNLEDLFEITELDRATLRPQSFDLRARTMSDYWHGVLLVQVQRAIASECYRRKTMNKLIVRFHESIPNRIPQDFLHFMDAVAPRSKLETLHDWINRIKKEQPYDFLKLCVLYDFKGLDLQDLRDLRDLQDPKPTRFEHLEQQLADRERAYLGITHRHFQSHMEKAEELELRAQWAVDPDADDHAAELVAQLNREISAFVEQRYVPRLYRFRLFQIFDQERAALKESVRLTCKAIGLPVKSPAGEALEAFLGPDYTKCPMRGPFRPGFLGGSSCPIMYGQTPNPMLYFCQCTTTGAYCGHLPFGLLLKRSHPTYRVRIL